MAHNCSFSPLGKFTCIVAVLTLTHFAVLVFDGTVFDRIYESPFYTQTSDLPKFLRGVLHLDEQGIVVKDAAIRFVAIADEHFWLKTICNKTSVNLVMDWKRQNTTVYDNILVDRHHLSTPVTNWTSSTSEPVFVGVDYTPPNGSTTQECPLTFVGLKLVRMSEQSVFNRSKRWRIAKLAAFVAFQVVCLMFSFFCGAVIKFDLHIPLLQKRRVEMSPLNSQICIYTQSTENESS